MTKITLLNTRPLSLQKETRDAFEKHGFEVIDLPCIEIVPLKTTKILEQLNNINTQDVVIFTSQYAVKHAFNNKPQFSLPKDSTVIAVGSKTAQILEQNYSGDIWIPEKQNSDGVIDLLKGLANCSSIKLISADEGRKLIRNYAQNNNIEWQQINVYKRQLPTVNKDSIELIKQYDPLCVLATSITTLNNLHTLIQNSCKEIWHELLQQPVVCASTRIEKAAAQLGFKHTQNVQTANPDLMAKRFIFSKLN